MSLGAGLHRARTWVRGDPLSPKVVESPSPRSTSSVSTAARSLKSGITATTSGYGSRSAHRSTPVRVRTPIHAAVPRARPRSGARALRRDFHAFKLLSLVAGRGLPRLTRTQLPLRGTRESARYPAPASAIARRDGGG